MGPPEWQFWTDWAVKALGTLATLLAVVVALFGARLRNWLAPPNLAIALADEAGWPAVLHMLDHRTNVATLTTGLWFHVRVSNSRRWSPVTGLHIMLISIEAPDAAERWQFVWKGQCPLTWRHEPSQAPKSVGYDAECDLCYVLKEPRGLRLSPMNRGQVEDTFRPGAIRIALTVQARGIEADSPPLRLELSWNGQWSDDASQMRRNFVIGTAVDSAR
jgi:hypothetical protein